MASYTLAFSAKTLLAVLLHPIQSPHAQEPLYANIMLFLYGTITLLVLFLGLAVVMTWLRLRKPRWRVKVADKTLLTLRHMQGRNISQRRMAYLKRIDPYVF
jgi:hypothetical protein